MVDYCDYDLLIYDKIILEWGSEFLQFLMIFRGNCLSRIYSFDPFFMQNSKNVKKMLLSNYQRHNYTIFPNSYYIKVYKEKLEMIRWVVIKFIKNEVHSVHYWFPSK